MQGCIFCKIVQGELNSKVVFEDDEILVFDDLNPQAPVHVVVIPKGHIDTIADVGEEHANLIGRLALAAKKIAKERDIEKDGYRLVINCNRGGGQAVFHLHLHLLGGRQMAWPPG